MIKKYTKLAILLLLLNSCAPRMSDQEICRSYGFLLGSSEFGHCMIQQQQLRMQRAALFQQGMQQTGQAFQQPIIQPTHYRQTNCTSSAYGNNVYTSCY